LGIGKIDQILWLFQDGRGESATNRQSVFDAYLKKYGRNRQMSLTGNIAFNGYDLSNRCVEV
jgi:hypothetical protein